MRTTPRRMSIAVASAVVVLAISAISAAASQPSPAPEPTDGGGGMAMCAPGVPDCVDTVVVPDGGTGSGSGIAGSCPVGTPDCNDADLGTGDAQIVEPTPGMADVFARPFDRAVVGDDDRTVTIDFVSGVEPCYVLDHVDVSYGADDVTITLFEGHDPAAGDVACIEIGVFKQVVVSLDEPLAGRTIVDGAAA